MTRRILFQVHWFLGITAGLVLAWMGVTGAIMTFREEMLEAISPALFAPGTPAGPDLAPDALVARIAAANPGYFVSRLDLETDRKRTHSAMVLKPDGKGWRIGQVDRATGAWLGYAPGSAALDAVADLHRWLTLPGGSNLVGRQVTGICALALVFFALSGLYLRWPRRVTDWRSWLVLDTHKTGRNFWRALHAVTGTWVFLAYLTSALTGLWWCYDWYERGGTYLLTGKEVASSPAPPPVTSANTGPLSIDRAWAQFRQQTGNGYASVRIQLPSPGQAADAVTFEARPFSARHLRQVDRFTYRPATGLILGRDFYDRRPLSTVVAESIFELHRGSFFGLPGRIVIFTSSALMPLFTITGYLLYLSRRRRKREARAQVSGGSEDGAAPITATSGTGELLIAFASQTGGAERLARTAAQAFHMAGQDPRLLPVAQLTPDALAKAKTALFVLSTYGEGEPPDMARGFARRLAHDPGRLDSLQFGILARGDREYRDFCGFGEMVDRSLADAGARALFPMIKMDGDDDAAVASWSEELARLGAQVTATPAQEWQTCRLVSRVALNPQSAHAKAFHLKFVPAEGSKLDWEAGDIAEIQPQNDPALLARIVASSPSLASLHGEAKQQLARAALPDGTTTLTAQELVSLRALPQREYSAASTQADGTLDLVVRQTVGPDGRLGIGSGWLTQYMGVGGTLALRMRANYGFRVADDAGPLILIGNGTGIAGLRAHIRAREQAGRGGHWLLFGERSRSHDAFFANEIDAWLANGTLARIDRSYSRDPDCGHYVQDLLAGAKDEIADWIHRGATVLVCGSLQGMAPAVHAALVNSVGAERLDQLAELGRYKRDVY